MPGNRNDMCRLCREPPVDGASIFTLDSNHQEFVSQMIASCTGVKIYDFDRLPELICRGCYAELDYAYGMWKRCCASRHHPKCAPETTEDDHYQCRICARDDSEELIAMNCPSNASEEPIYEIFWKFCDLSVQVGDGLAPYLCDVCLGQLERAYKFTQRCLWVEAVFLEESVFPWEKMEFQAEDPTMLVVETQAKLLDDGSSSGVLKCSVCGQIQDSGECRSSCRGCLLKFCNIFEWRETFELYDEEQYSRPNSPEDASFDPSAADCASEASLSAEGTGDEENAEGLRITTKKITKYLEKRSLTLAKLFRTVEDFPLYARLQRVVPLCCGCNDLFLTTEALSKHRSLQHSSKSLDCTEQNVCSVCLTAFETKAHYLRHRTVVERGMFDYCKICDKILLKTKAEYHFRTSHTLQWKSTKRGRARALSVQSDDEDPQFSDDENPDVKSTVPLKGVRRFLRTLSLRIADVFLEIPSGQGENFSKLCRKHNFCCGCKLFFVSRHALTSHLKATHPGRHDPKDLKCRFCRTTFPTRAQRKEHMRRDAFYYCKICDQMFLVDADFHRHRLEKHITSRQRRDMECMYSKTSTVSHKRLKTSSGTGKALDIAGYTCKVSGCVFEATNEESFFVHCLANHQQEEQGSRNSEPKHRPNEEIDDGLNLVTENDRRDLVPLDSDFTEETEPLIAVPLKKVQAFLVKNSLNMEDLFEVVADNKFNVNIRRNKPFCCGCNSIFFTEEALANHKSQKHPEPTEIGPLTCDACYTVFKVRKQYKNHLDKLLPENMLHNYCKLCDQVLMESPFGRHLYMKHLSVENQKRFERMYTSIVIYGCTETEPTAESGDPGSCKCPKCGRLFDNDNDLSRHTKRKKYSEYLCRIGNCSFKTLNENHIMYHCMLMSHSDFLENFSCFVATADVHKFFEVILDPPEATYRKIRRKGSMCCGCNQFFRLPAQLSNHIEKVHPKPADDAKWVCEFCSKAFGCLESRQCHEIKRTTETFDYCETCQLVLEDGSYFRHEATKHPRNDQSVYHPIEDKFSKLSETRFICCAPQCGHQFDSQTHLSNHLSAAHPVTKQEHQNACLYCDTQFDTIEQFFAHDSNRKTESVSYSCRNEHCEFITHVREDMLRHGTEVTHSILPAAKDTTGDASDQAVPVGTVHGIIDVFRRQGEVCCQCRILFKSVEKQQKHMAKRHAQIQDDLPFHCDACNKGFKFERWLAIHQKNSQTYYRCQVCKVMLLDTQQVTHHMSLIHAFEEPAELSQFYKRSEFEDFPCCGCEELFATEQELAEHCRSVHPPSAKAKKAKFVCEHCNRTFSVRQLHQSHCAVYASKIVYRCALIACNLQTTSLEQIEQHVSTKPHERKKRRPYPDNPTEHHCCVRSCDFQAESYDTVIEHATSEHDELRRSWRGYSKNECSCPVCCKPFPTESLMLHHRNAAFLKSCITCAELFLPSELDAHAAKCIKTCHHCGEQFMVLSDYRKHMRAVHGVGKSTSDKKKSVKEICSVCGCLIARSRMSDHLAGHDDNRRWACPHCPQRFNIKPLLTIHLRQVHSTEKRFKCRMGCENRYKGAGDRTRHEKLVHTGDLPFKCQLCEAAFVRERDLRLHMQRHNGQKLYSCDSCSESFDKKSELTEHAAECEGAAAAEDMMVEYLCYEDI